MASKNEFQLSGKSLEMSLLPSEIISPLTLRPSQRREYSKAQEKDEIGRDMLLDPAL
jgi:hypothetical protein